MIALNGSLSSETQLTKRQKKQYSSFGTNIWGESGSSYVVLFLSIGSQKREPCFKTLNNFCPFDDNLVFQ